MSKKIYDRSRGYTLSHVIKERLNNFALKIQLPIPKKMAKAFPPMQYTREQAEAAIKEAYLAATAKEMIQIFTELDSMQLVPPSDDRYIEGANNKIRAILIELASMD